MASAAAAYNVGGMAAFWTATTLHQQPNLERSPLISDEEWEELYSEADAVLKTASDLFDFSIRHTVVADALRRAYSDQTEKLSIEKAPYAGRRDPHCSTDVQWNSIDVILGEQLMQMLNDSKQSVFQLKVRVLRMVALRCISSSYSIHKYFINMYGRGALFSSSFHVRNVTHHVFVWCQLHLVWVTNVTFEGNHQSLPGSGLQWAFLLSSMTSKNEAPPLHVWLLSQRMHSLFSIVM